MSNFDNGTLITRLCSSFQRQLVVYGMLNVVARRIMSQLVLSRGNMNGVAAAFEEKQQLLSEIQHEREDADPLIREWQERKGALRGTVQADELDIVLDTVQRAVKEFLDGEEQLHTWLEHAAGEGNG